MKVVHELLSAPFGLEQVGQALDYPLYSSSNLKSNFIKAMSKVGIVNPIHHKIKELVDRNIIIPCTTYSGVIDMLWKKTLDKKPAYIGVYDQEANRVFILSDIKSKDFFNHNNTDLAITLIHELMHYSASNFKNKFYTMYKKELLIFYKNFFYFYLGRTNLNDKSINFFLNYLFTNWEYSENKNLKKYNSVLLKMFYDNRIDETKIEELASNITNMINVYFKNQKTFINIASDENSKYYFILSCLYSSYIQTFHFKDVQTFPIQELMFPSEVICVASEQPHNFSKIYQSIIWL